MNTWFRALTQSPDGYLWNVTLDPGSGGATCATDTIAGVEVQKIKLMLGAPGIDGGVVTPANPIPTRSNGATSTLASVVANASSVTVLPSNASRLRAWLYNDADKIAYVKFGATASISSFTKKLLPEEFFAIEGYTGIVDAIWESGPSGSIRTTELTA